MSTEKNNIDATAIAASLLPSLKQKLVTELEEMLTREAKSQAATLVRDHVKDWFAKEYAPALTDALNGQKDELLTAAVNAAEAIGESLKTAIVAEAQKNLSQSWTRSKVVGAMMGHSF